MPNIGKQNAVEDRVDRPASSDAQSALVDLFVTRTGLAADTTPEEAMVTLVRRIIRTCRQNGSAEHRLQHFIRKRNVRFVDRVADVTFEGSIEPLGRTFRDGFRARLRRSSTPERARFSLAHEICHTFFYELVPEMKFRPHPTDPLEERLCDIGAAELLMPVGAVRRSAQDLPVALSTLFRLASEYSVSIPAMFLRLRALSLWRCELSEWRTLSDGTLTLHQLYGGKSLPWRWDDQTITSNDLCNDERVGRTFISYVNDRGVCFCRPVRYQLQRFGDRLLALWGPDVQHAQLSLPLFEKLPKARSRLQLHEATAELPSKQIH
jgi:hypothetical protein